MRAPAAMLLAALIASPVAHAEDARQTLRDILNPVLRAARDTPPPSALRPVQEYNWKNYIRRMKEGATESYRDLQNRAMDKVIYAQRPDSCDIRRARLVAAAPAALRYLRMSEEVYASTAGTRMAAEGLTETFLSDVRLGYQERQGEHYAELVLDDEQMTATLVFRGTRRRSINDIVTDLAQFAGVDTAYYRWAAELAGKVRSDHSGYRIIATGHSLGGGLAIWSAMTTADVEAIAFNPAGIAPEFWAGANNADRDRALSAVTNFVAVTPLAVDPVAATSLAGLSVIPGRIYAIPVQDRGDPKVRHGIPALDSALLQIIASGGAGDACDYDIGFAGARVDNS